MFTSDDGFAKERQKSMEAEKRQNRTVMVVGLDLLGPADKGC